MAGIVCPVSFARAQPLAVQHKLRLAFGLALLSGVACAGGAHAATAPAPSCVAPATYECSQAPARANVAYGIAANTLNPSAPSVTLRFDVYRPQSFGVTPNGNAVVVVHGGGWEKGDKTATGFVWISNDLAANGFIVYNIDYRLAPGCTTSDCAYYAGTGRYLDLVSDVETAVHWVRNHNALAGGSATPKIGLLGGSAGGHLSDLVAETGTPGDTRPDAMVSLSGPAETRLDKMVDPTTGQPMTDSSSFGQVLNNYIGCPYYASTSPSACPDKYTTVSPVARAAAQTPPTLLVAAPQDNGGIIYSADKSYQSALQPLGVTAAWRTPTESTCHSVNCWYVTTQEDGRLVATDSVRWFQHFLVG